MATSTLDGTIEEVVIKRRRSQGSFYERIKFRLDDGGTRTWTRLQVMNEVAALLTPGTRGRFYRFDALDHRGLSGVRAEDGKEAFKVARLNEYIGIGLVVFNLLLTILYHTVLDDISEFARITALFLLVAGVPMYFYYRHIRTETEKAFRRDEGFRPSARAA
jgi:hypothetical protein